MCHVNGDGDGGTCDGFGSCITHAACQIGANIIGEATDDHFGTSIAMSGDGTRIAVGARNHDNAFINVGHVRVYDLEGGSWTQIGDIHGDSWHDQAAYVAMARDGTHIAIGAPGHDGDGTSRGRVRVYKFLDHSWTQQGEDIEGEEDNILLGKSVALSDDGSTIAIGSSRSRNSQGHVRVFKFENQAGISLWNQVGGDIVGEEISDYSGRSVSLSGNGTMVVIGAPWNDGEDAGSRRGHIRVYKFESDDWVQLGNDIDGEDKTDSFGDSVAISFDGLRVAAGSTMSRGPSYTSQLGHVRVFDLHDQEWIQVGGDIAGEAAFDRFGSSLAMSDNGSRVVIGAHYNDAGGHQNVDRGHVQVYGLDSGKFWNKICFDIDGEAKLDKFGSSVAISSDASKIAIGSMYHDTRNGEDSGYVRVFDLIKGQECPTCDDSNKCTVDTRGVGGTCHHTSRFWPECCENGNSLACSDEFCTVEPIEGAVQFRVTVGERPRYDAGRNVVFEFVQANGNAMSHVETNLRSYNERTFSLFTSEGIRTDKVVIHAVRYDNQDFIYSTGSHLQIDGFDVLTSSGWTSLLPNNYIFWLNNPIREVNPFGKNNFCSVSVGRCADPISLECLE